jgi:ribosomal protein S18 acetylase RimI-like enzyme
MKIRTLRKIEPELLEIMEKMDKESMGDASIDRYTIKSMAEMGSIIVAEKDKEIVAVCQLLRDIEIDSRLQIFGFYVVPKWRKNGIGTTFMEKLIKYVKTLKYNSLELTVSPENRGAISVYEKNGFNITKLSKNHYGYGIDRFIMELEF